MSKKRKQISHEIKSRILSESYISGCVISDLAKLIVVNSSSNANITVPADNTVNFNVGDRIDFVTINTGLVTFIAGGGVTVNGTPGLNLRTQYSGATLVKLATNTWVAMGDLKA